MSNLPLEPTKTHSLPTPLPAAPSTLISSTQTPISPTRPKHLSTRSITEVNAPPSLPRIPGNSGKHHHHHHHHPHIHHGRHRDKERDGMRGVDGRDGSAEYGNAIGGSRSEGHTPSESRVGSRRGSFNWKGEDGSGLSRERKERERVVREGEVREERERGVLRATELRNALNTLNTHSNITTRRLDTTYYSVLEKLSTLQSTITSLKELAHLTRGLTESFSSEAQEVVDEVTGQVDTFGGFKEQEGRIGELMDRVKKGRERIQRAGERVERVKSRVEGWEVAEGEWQDRTRRRLRVLWVGFSFVLAVVVVVMAVQFSGAGAGEDGSEKKGLNVTGLLGVIPDMQGLRGGNESWGKKGKGLGESVLEKLRVDKPVEEDPRLRVFDEL
ncbi:hypothetical protein VTL71DRAFT_13955 [Oculimacula yallundae]|uniref:Uncharacterized protein n=1 Tax=Oculimacula yallundae TaxID=86028 RepID=A0ABR4CLV5_9HELO